MKKKVVYVFMDVKIVNGEHEFRSPSVHAVTIDENKDKEKQLDEFADEYYKNFYDGGDGVKNDSGYFEFDFGCIWVRPSRVEEISKAKYDAMKEFI